jgi:hypothetical protein
MLRVALQHLITQVVWHRADWLGTGRSLSTGRLRLCRGAIIIFVSVGTLEHLNVVALIVLQALVH